MLDYPKYLIIYRKGILVISYFRDAQLWFNPTSTSIHMYERNISHKDNPLRNTHPFFLEFFFGQ